MDSSQPSDAVPDEARAGKAIPADPALRATDADRDRTASLLQAAVADGRVSVGELEERLESVYSAKSTGELAALVKDLQPARLAGATPTSSKDVGVLNDFTREGRWVVGDTYRSTAVISTGVIDLREVRFTSPETTIRVNSVIGTVYVVVPENAEVHVAGSGILGGFHQDRENLDAPGTHRIKIVGTAVIGSVYVVHDLPAAVQRRLMKRKQRGLGKDPARKQIGR